MKKQILILFSLSILFILTTSESCNKNNEAESNKETNEQTEVAENNSETETNNEELWIDVDKTTIVDPAFNEIIPKESRLVNLNVDQLRNILKDAPQETAGIGIEACPVIHLPLPDGTTRSFHVFESHSMDPELAKKYGLSSFTGQGIEDKSSTLKCELSPDGFRAQILSTEGTIVIDPVKDSPENWYMSYRK